MFSRDGDQDFLKITPIMLSFVASLSLIIYNTGTTLVTYLLLSAYQCIRHYFLYIHGKDYTRRQLLDYIEFSLCIFLGFMVIFYVARSLTIRQREKFI